MHEAHLCIILQCSSRWPFPNGLGQHHVCTHLPVAQDGLTAHLPRRAIRFPLVFLDRPADTCTKNEIYSGIFAIDDQMSSKVDST